MNKQKILDKIEELKKLIDIEESELALETHNSSSLSSISIRVNSMGWTKKGEVLENSEGDIWEIIDGKCTGEQLFIWDAAMRETKKAGKRMPTDEEFSKILKTKADMPNLIFFGYRYTTDRLSVSSFYDRLTDTKFWSSSQYDASSAWIRYLYSGDSTVYLYYDNKAHGFSVRCLNL